MRILGSIVLIVLFLMQGCSEEPITAKNLSPTGTVVDSGSSYFWRPLKIGSGGWKVGIDIATDGTKVVRSDVFGAYYRDDEKAEWIQLVSATSMPSEDVVLGGESGVYEIRVAPSNPSRFYMNYRGFIYRTENRGQRWIKTNFTKVSANANDAYRTNGQRIAVDPANADVVYVGTPENGLFVSFNAGATWAAVTSVPAGIQVSGVYPGISGIAFDTGSGTTSGRTNTIFAASRGNGVYRSLDAGATWSLLAGSPTVVRHGKLASDGAYYTTGETTALSIFRYLAGTWTNISPGTHTYGSVAINPNNPAHLVASRNGGQLNISLDRGATWGGSIDGGGATPILRAALDIPWLAWTTENYFSMGDITFDPLVANRIWIGQGIGVWNTDLSPTQPTTQGPIWFSFSKGIEDLVANRVVSPPGGKPLVASWDRPIFRIENPNAFPFTHGPDRVNPVVHGWSIDYSGQDSKVLGAIANTTTVERSSFSLDGGLTWAVFPSYPPLQSAGKIGGTIAVSTPRVMLWVPSNDGNPYYTLNGGINWTQAVVPGVPTSGTTGWGYNHVFNRYIAAADRVNAGTYYMYNYLAGSAGVYRSINGGVTWTLVKSGELTPNSQYHAKLEAVPRKAGHLFFTAGAIDYPGAPHPATDQPFLRSKDGGVTWTAVPNVLEVRAFGLGKEAVPGGYPSIFIVGYVNGIYGIYRSDNEGQTWVKFGDYPGGNMDFIKTIGGDGLVHGAAYVGFVGSGYAYYGPAE